MGFVGPRMQRPPLRSLRTLVSGSFAAVADAVAADSSRRSRLRPTASTVGRPLRTAGFWAAVSLPMVHVPLLLSGLDSTAEAAVFAVLLAANLLALLLGHGHDPG